MQGLLAVRIVRVESVPQQIAEQMVVPVGISGQLDQEEVPLVDAPEQRAGVASLGHRRATLGVEVFEDRSREQEVEDLSGLAFEYLRSEEVSDRAWRLRELCQEEIGDRFVAKGHGRHLDTGSPTLGTGREELDCCSVQLDSELEHDGGDFGSREPEFSVAHLEQLPVRTKSVQRELGLSAAADDHATAGREALDERGQAGCRSRRELEVVDHDHDRFAERREVVHDRDRDVTELRFRLAQQVGRVEPAVGPPANERGGQRRPKGGRIGIALVARKPDRRKLGAIVHPGSEHHALACPGRADDDRQRDVRTCVEGRMQAIARNVPAGKCGRRELRRGQQSRSHDSRSFVRRSPPMG